MRVGDLELVPLSDGTAVLPRNFYVDLDWSAHHELLGRDGRIHMPIGCYLVRGGDHPTEVKFTVAYKRANFDGWVVTLQKRGQRDPGRVLLRSSTI